MAGTCTNTWKSIERKVAKILGGTRTGRPAGCSIYGAIEDVSHPLFSIEVKHGSTKIPKLFTKAYNQCKANNKDNKKIPLVVLHAERSKDFLCVIEAKDLARVIMPWLKEIETDSILDKVREDVERGTMTREEAMNYFGFYKKEER